MDALNHLVKKITEQRKPSLEGIWYYTYLHPEWKLEVYRSDDYGGIGHVGVWGKYLSGLFMGHYKLDSSKLSQVRGLVYSMPRGRMERITPEIHQEGQKPGHWYLWHGDDFPKSLIVEVEKRRILSEFELNTPAAAGMTHWEVSAHEGMVKEQQAELQKVLGVRIPY